MLSRRDLFRSAFGTVLATGSQRIWSSGVAGPPRLAENPFTLGIASGDPTPDGVVLWTKLAPRPLEPAGGLSPQSYNVTWHVAADESMRQVIQSGTTRAGPELGHSVHVEVTGLKPSRDYFYQFHVGNAESSIGRTRTLPVLHAPISELRFGVVGCQNYEQGWFTGFRHLADERMDFVFHYGDYIYEARVSAPETLGYPLARRMPGDHDTCQTLDQYRFRYSVYQSDPDLQAAHAFAPFIVSYDDNDVLNDWAGDTTIEHFPRERFLTRRAAAFQAWYEHMPVRRRQMPHGPKVMAYRRFAFGDLVAMNVLDTRLYRSRQACGGGIKTNCAEALEPDRTMMGASQERWLYDSFKKSTSRWTLLAQQVIMMRCDRDPDPSVFGPSMDKWDGAVAARDRLFAAIDSAKLPNVIVVTGDIHNNWAGELKRSFDDERSATVGLEFVGTSMSSGGDGFDINDASRTLVAQNPHVRFFNNQRGYVRHVVTPREWRADFRVVDKVSTPGGRVSTRKSLVVESGVPKLMEALRAPTFRHC